MKADDLILPDSRHAMARPVVSAAGRAVPSRTHAPYRVHIETFGCQMNEYDTELVRSMLKADGYVFTDDKEGADVVLMNTCAIRENAHTKVYGHLARLQAIKRRRTLVVGVLGCMAQNLKQDLMDHASIVDVLVGPDAYRRLPHLISKAIQLQDEGSFKGLAVDLSESETYDDILPDRVEGVNAWIAVMRGCDNFCSFCVVPYTRGRERSRDPQGIIREVEHLVAHGYKQVTLLGQNVNSYRFGEDVRAHHTWDFARLVTAVADIPGIERVRFTSPHPKDFPPALLDAVTGHPKICTHIHLPLQSGNDRILAMMNRTYTRQDYLTLVEDIQRRCPDIVLTTDLICGFCTETEQDFLDTFQTVQEVGFNEAYVFKYSERKHTVAGRKYPDDIPEEIKTDRLNRLVSLVKASSLQKNRDTIGRTYEVLVEGDSKKSSSQWMGRTDGGITVVWEKTDVPTRPGDLVRIKVSDASVTTLFGDPIPA